MIDSSEHLYHINPLPGPFCGVPQQLRIGYYICFNKGYNFAYSEEGHFITKYNTLTQDTSELKLPANSGCYALHSF